MAYSTISKSTLHFETKLWTGNGSTQTITGFGFQPDMVWLKQRTSSTRNHNLYDAVRGATARIYPDDTSGQDTASNGLTGFTSDGFTLGNDTSNSENSGTYVSWNWKAGGAGSANSDGSTATVKTSANATAGISVVQYTGNGANRTMGHGLGIAPDMILTKQTSGTRDWYVGATSIGWAAELYLQSSAGSASSPSTFNSTAPTTSVFSIGSGSAANSNGETFMAYCFADVKGFSKIGKQYSGNGNADGPFVFCGFKPAWVLIKREQGGQNWNIYDNKRLGYNGGDAPLFADLNNVESTDYGRIDFLSNGFKIRTTNGQLNTDGNSYTYMAFAEAPLVGSNNQPSTAR
mgnify:CR=1 FL=1|tara:strand:- start:58 stop:1098 length:1041 start_codon:yes stop_codon:yes gene_type:complete